MEFPDLGIINKQEFINKLFRQTKKKKVLIYFCINIQF